MLWLVTCDPGRTKRFESQIRELAPYFLWAVECFSIYSNVSGSRYTLHFFLPHRVNIDILVPCMCACLLTMMTTKITSRVFAMALSQQSRSNWNITRMNLIEQKWRNRTPPLMKSLPWSFSTAIYLIMFVLKSLGSCAIIIMCIVPQPKRLVLTNRWHMFYYDLLPWITCNKNMCCAST